MSCSDVEIPLAEPSAKYNIELSNSGRRMVIRKILLDPKHSSKKNKKESCKEERTNKQSKVETRSHKMKCVRTSKAKSDDDRSSLDSEDGLIFNKPNRKREDKLNDKSIAEILYDSDSTSNENVSDSSYHPKSGEKTDESDTGTDEPDVGAPKKINKEREKWLASLRNKDFSNLCSSKKSKKSPKSNSKFVNEKRIHSQTRETKGKTERLMSPRKDLSKTGMSEKENSKVSSPEHSKIEIRTSQRQRKQKYDSSKWELPTVKVTPVSERRKKIQKHVIKSDSSQDSSDDENSLKHKYVKVAKHVSSRKELFVKMKRIDSPKHSNRRNINSVYKIYDNSEKVESCARKSMQHSPYKAQKEENVMVSEGQNKSPVKLKAEINDNLKKVESCVRKSMQHSPYKTSRKLNINVLDEQDKSPAKNLKVVLNQEINDNLKKTESCTKKSMQHSPYKTPRKHNINNSEEQDKSPTKKLKESQQNSPIMLCKETQNEHTPLRKVATPFVLRTGGKLLTPATPSSTKGRSKRQVCTPSMPTCKRTFGTPQTPLQEAMSRLHVAAVPQSLPCREAEFENIHRFLEGKILDGAGGSIYISGVPGTGKTATVREVVRSLKKDVESDDLPDFQFIEINGMRLSHPRQAYVQIWKAVSNEVVTVEQAQRLLENRFTKNTKKGKETTVLLVDEVDVLWTRRQDVVYNLLDWPSKARSHLVVVTIANTMDLPERLLMGRVTSRLGLTRLTFQPYTHKQLEDIVRARLKGINAFDSDAIQFVSRKVASVSGDARRALDICRRATEIAEQESPEALVTIKHIDEAMLVMTSSNTVRAITQACSTMEKMFLQSVEAELSRTGLEETTFHKAYKMMETLCTLEGMEIPSVTVMLHVCMNLSSMRLLLCQHSQRDIYTRIFLNISADDLHYALKCMKNIEMGKR